MDDRLDRPDRKQASEPTGRFKLAVVGWIAAVLVTLVAVAAIGFDNHLACGGTLGGYGEGATTRLNEDCMAARQWRELVPFGILLVLIGVRVRAARRRRRGRT